MHMHIIKDIPAGSLLRLKTLKQFGYSVSGVIITAADIEYGILRRNLMAPNFLGVEFLTPKFASTKHKFLLEKSYPLICFVICSFTKSGVNLRYYTENVMDEINEAAKFYLQNTVFLDNHISLPRMIDWFQYDFGSTINATLGYLSSFLEEDKGSILKEKMKNSFAKFRSHDWDFAFKWENNEYVPNEREEEINIEVKEEQTENIKITIETKIDNTNQTIDIQLETDQPKDIQNIETSTDAITTLIDTEDKSKNNENNNDIQANDLSEDSDLDSIEDPNLTTVTKTEDTVTIQIENTDTNGTVQIENTDTNGKVQIENTDTNTNVTIQIETTINNDSNGDSK